MSAPALSVAGLGKRFGRIDVLADLSFDVAPGEALGIIGPNGAGKSTLLNVISGVIPAGRGRIHVDGTDVTRLPPHARARRGVGRSYQVPRPFENMTVFENVLVASTFGAGCRGKQAAALAMSALERSGLAARADERAGSLRLLDRKRLELARALGTAPTLVLLDEIAGGLTEAEVPQLVTTVSEVRASGVTVVWIEHVVQALLAVADRLMCLTYGRMVIIGEPHTVMASPEVREIYLGTDPGGVDTAGRS